MLRNVVRAFAVTEGDVDLSLRKPLRAETVGGVQRAGTALALRKAVKGGAEIVDILFVSIERDGRAG